MATTFEDAVMDEETVEERVAREVEALWAQKRARGRLVIRMPNREVFIPVEEIDWIESDRNNVRVHSGSRSFTIRDTLSNTESRLPDTLFARVQRSVIVNAEKVEEIRKVGREYEIILRGGARLPLSKNCYGDLSRVLATL